MPQEQTVSGRAYSLDNWEPIDFTVAAKDGRIDFPAGAKSIGYCSFYAKGIRSVAFPEGLEKIGDVAFEECHIKEIVLPASLKKIGGRNFGDAEDIRIQGGRPIPGLLTSFLDFGCILPGSTIGQPFVRIHITGEIIICPKYAEWDKIIGFVSEWDAGNLDLEATKYLYRASSVKTHFQDAALAALELCPDDAGIMANVCASFLESAKRYIKAGQGDELMKLLRLCPMPEGAAGELINTADGCGDGTAKAYILAAAVKRIGQGNRESALKL